MTEYAERFKHLSRFYTLTLDEEWRCRKFENDLGGDIRLMVASLSIMDFAALVEKARVIEKMKNEVEGQRSQHLRGVVDHLGPSPDMTSGGDRMTDPLINLRGLGVFLPSRVECSATYVGALIRGVPARVWRVIAGATTVARKATLGRIVPTLPGQQHALQFRLPISIRGGTGATGLKRQAGYMP